MSKEDYAILLLRIGISFILIYAAVSAYLNPSAWIGFYPIFLQNSFSDTILLNSSGLVELVVAGFLLFQKRPYYASIVAATLMAGIVVFNFGALDIVFRDVGLVLAAVALAVATKKDRPNAEH